MKMKKTIKKIISAVMTLAMVVSLFPVAVFAAEFSEANISKGNFDFFTLGATDGSYTFEQQKDSQGRVAELNLQFEAHGTARDKMMNYVNKSGVDAKFAHVRFYVKGLNSTPVGQDDLYASGIRITHYTGSTESLRFNLGASMSIFDGDNDLRGYALNYTYKHSNPDEEVYNKFDYIADCENGVVYLIVNDVLNAFCTDATRDGKFYGFDISKMESGWEKGDTFTAKFEEENYGHTIYKDAEGYEVTIDDVLADAGISADVIAPYRKKIDNAAEYVKKNAAFVHERPEPFLVTGPGLIIPVEEANYTSHFDVTIDRNAGGVKAMKSNYNNNTNPASTASPHIEVKFTVEEKASYNVWIRTFANTNRSDSFFYAFGNNAYKQQAMTRGEDYRWYRLHSQIMEPGTEYKVRLRGREKDAAIDCVLVTRVPGLIPEGRYGNMPDELLNRVEILDASNYPAPPINPPKNEHPRVLFLKEDIPRIIENLNHPDNAGLKERYDYFLEEGVTKEQTSYSAWNFSAIEVHALDYALFGNKQHGRDAIDALMFMMENVSLSNSGLLYREAGHFIHSAGKVYDWCYDLLTPAERDKILLNSVVFAGSMENGWPPEKQGAFTGHGAEAQLLRDLLTLAIAVYDERPDLWDFIGGRYYREYVPARRVFDTGLLQGSDYGLYRQMWSAYSYALIKGMGGEVPIDLEQYEDNTLWQLYFRRPDGQMVRDGDISAGDKNQIWYYWEDFKMTYLLDAYLTENPYLKREYAKMSPQLDPHMSNNDYSSTADAVIFLEPSTPIAKNHENLPLSKYFDSGVGTLIARTGWEDGAESPAVVANMKLGEHQVNGHMHLDAGSFQLYYKGALATESGVYQGANNSTSGNGASAFGSEHFNYYATKTIAHNAMLVYDPSEAGKAANARSTILDGGQRAVHNSQEYNFKQIAGNEDEYKVSDLQGLEIDPTDPIKPAYTYMKGDFTNAYTDKVSDHKRSFMFLNLDNEEVPAALIVFDKIDSSNPSFKKTWLLHTIEEPQINGNQTVAMRTYKSPVKAYGYNGKLTLDTLLPKSSNIEKVGGDQTGWYTVNGKNYDGQKFASETDEGQTWRVEVSPTAANKEDHFLNVMQVSDADKENYLPTELVENDLFYGVTISDRAVFFSKDAKRTEGDFELSIPGSGKFQYTICDVSAGVYEVTVNGELQTIGVTEEGGVLAFTAEAGNVSVHKTDAEAPQAKKAEVPDPVDTNKVSLRIDNVFIYDENPAYIKEGSTVVTADTLARQYGINISDDSNTVKIWNKNSSITLTNGSKTALTNDGEITLPIAPWYENGKMWVPLRQVTEALGGTVEWDRFSTIVYITSPARDLSLPEGFVRFSEVLPDDGSVDGENYSYNVFDEDPDTIWASNGKGRYITIILEKESDIDAIEVMFNPNQGRNAAFEVAISNDGQNYQTIYSGTGDGSVESGAWEHFDFGSVHKAKYVRFIGQGSNISNWNAVKEIRISGK